MTGEKELTRDFLMCYHNVHGKTWGREVRIHQTTTFLARKRVVRYRRQCTKQRMLPFLPLKHTETKEYLKIPPHITTEDQLWDYVKEKKSSWLYHHSRRPR